VTTTNPADNATIISGAAVAEAEEDVVIERIDDIAKSENDPCQYRSEVAPH
jgi:hypothetical protein